MVRTYRPNAALVLILRGAEVVTGQREAKALTKDVLTRRKLGLDSELCADEFH